MFCDLFASRNHKDILVANILTVSSNSLLTNRRMYERSLDIICMPHWNMYQFQKFQIIV
jgi:hypothetical protein